MTTSLFAVLPLLTEQAKALVREYADVDAEQAAATDVIVPASFNFPHTGKLLSLSFVLFAGWFADARVPVSDYPRLAGTGLLVMFGSVNAADSVSAGSAADSGRHVPPVRDLRPSSTRDSARCWPPSTPWRSPCSARAR